VPKIGKAMQVKIFVEPGSDQWEELEKRYLEKHPSRKDLVATSGSR
jgi:hypothetical protein